MNKTVGKNCMILIEMLSLPTGHNSQISFEMWNRSGRITAAGFIYEKAMSNYFIFSLFLPLKIFNNSLQLYFYIYTSIGTVTSTIMIERSDA